MPIDKDDAIQTKPSRNRQLFQWERFVAALRAPRQSMLVTSRLSKRVVKSSLHVSLTQWVAPENLNMILRGTRLLERGR